MLVKVVINETHQLLPDQLRAIRETFGSDAQIDRVNIPAEGLTLDQQIDMAKELLREMDELNDGAIVFVSPIPVLLGVVSAHYGYRQADDDYMEPPDWKVFVFHNDKREKKELPDGGIISVVAQEGWQLVDGAPNRKGENDMIEKVKKLAREYKDNPKRLKEIVGYWDEYTEKEVNLVLHAIAHAGEVWEEEEDDPYSGEWVVIKEFESIEEMKKVIRDNLRGMEFPLGVGTLKWFLSLPHEREVYLDAALLEDPEFFNVQLEYAAYWEMYDILEKTLTFLANRPDLSVVR